MHRNSANSFKKLFSGVRGLGAVAAVAAALAGCRYYEVTGPDGTTQRISASEYEELQQNARRLGNVPSSGSRRSELIQRRSVESEPAKR